MNTIFIIIATLVIRRLLVEVFVLTYCNDWAYFFRQIKSFLRCQK